MIIRVLSFDFDGCLFHRTYVKAADKDVIKHNEAFFTSIQVQTATLSASRVITFVGSNRQSFVVDLENSFQGKGSCFPAIQNISTYLKADFDPFLLADVYGRLDAGSSFRLATATPIDYAAPHAHWLFDNTKMTVLYAQMHRVAMQNPSDQIFYDFFDDREKDILPELKTFYSKYSDLIPHNVILRLHKYDGGAVLKIIDIQGRGMIDQKYCSTVREMGNIAMKECNIKENSESFYNAQLDVLRFITPDQLTCREALIIASPASEQNVIVEAVATSMQDTLSIEPQRELEEAALDSARQSSDVADDAVVIRVNIPQSFFMDNSRSQSPQQLDVNVSQDVSP